VPPPDPVPAGPLPSHYPYVTQDNWAGGGDETYRLQPAGLLGPVTIQYAE